MGILAAGAFEPALWLVAGVQERACVQAARRRGLYFGRVWL
jgi:hypothetical protein